MPKISLPSGSSRPSGTNSNSTLNYMQFLDHTSGFTESPDWSGRLGIYLEASKLTKAPVSGPTLTVLKCNFLFIKMSCSIVCVLNE